MLKRWMLAVQTITSGVDIDFLQISGNFMTATQQQSLSTFLIDSSTRWTAEVYLQNPYKQQNLKYWEKISKESEDYIKQLKIGDMLLFKHLLWDLL